MILGYFSPDIAPDAASGFSNVSGQESGFIINWTAVDGADHYKLIYPVLATITDTDHAVEGLRPLSTYGVLLQAISAGGSVLATASDKVNTPVAGQSVTKSLSWT